MTVFDKIYGTRQEVDLMNYEDLGLKINVERTKQKYNQDEVAEEVGVGQRYLSKIEHGHARPEFEKVFKIAQMLGLSLDYLAGIEPAETNSDYLTNTINIRLQLLNDEEKFFLLEAIEYYIQNVRDKKKVSK